MGIIYETYLDPQTHEEGKTESKKKAKIREDR